MTDRGATSPRLDRDEFVLTPVGRRGRDPSGRTHDTDSPTRARGPWADPTPAVETEDTTLDEHAGSEEVADD